MMIGAYGPIAFEVSSEQALTFAEMTRTRKAKYAKHKYLDRKPAVQANGFEADTISFSIRLLVETGTNPRKELDKMGQMLASQNAYRLVIGGESLGRFHLEEISETWERVDNKGNLLSAEVALKLLEAAS